MQGQLVDGCPFPAPAVPVEEVAFLSLAQVVTAILLPKVTIPSVLPVWGLLTQFGQNKLTSRNQQFKLHFWRIFEIIKRSKKILFQIYFTAVNLPSGFGTPGFIQSQKEPHNQSGPPPKGQDHLTDYCHDWIGPDVSNTYANFRHLSLFSDGHVLLENSLIQHSVSLKFQCPWW